MKQFFNYIAIVGNINVHLSVRDFRHLSKTYQQHRFCCVTDANLNSPSLGSIGTLFILDKTIECQVAMNLGRNLELHQNSYVVTFQYELQSTKSTD